LKTPLEKLIDWYLSTGNGWKKSAIKVLLLTEEFMDVLDRETMDQRGLYYRNFMEERYVFLVQHTCCS
jgi:hypothetical protein